MNTINNLLKTPFSSLSYDDKLVVKNLGRHLPDLNLTVKQQSSNKERLRKFNSNIYSKNSWICGCDTVNALFCFPCVLFGGDASWTKNGITDLVHIWDKIKKHEKSAQHMNNVLSLSLLGKTNIQARLNSQYHQSIVKHNEQVDKNRYILNLIINCIRFCGALELALRGHDESEDSSNKGVFRELIDFSAELDKDLKYHLSHASVFKGTSKTIQNELLQCMLEVYHDEVYKEIKSVDYIAIIADETTDISAQFQLVLVLRYIVGGIPVERFWNFANPDGHDARAIADCILNQLNPLISENPNKLIAQTFDGASVMSGGVNGVQKLIKDKYPYANFIHCYAHQFNLVMSHASSINRHARIFFAHLSGLCTFFSHSPQRTKILDDIVHKRLPRASEIRWNFHSRGVNTVYEYRKELIEVMETLEHSENVKLQTTIEQAGAYKLRLQENTFVFWLTFFHRIMPHVEIIFAQLQKKIIDPLTVRENIHNFEKGIQGVREEIDVIIEEVKNELEDDDNIPSKRSRLANRGSECLRSEAIEVCDTIAMEIKSRFEFSGHLIATNLFVVEEFDKYHRKFPEEYLNEMVEKYPLLEKKRLRSELAVLYEREEVKSVSGAVPFLSLVIEDGLCETFSETVKLLKLLITMPMSTSEAERCFSALKRIKTFLRNSMKEERLSALGMLSCEKSFVNKIADFNKRVIDLFANQKNRRMDFVYRAH